MDSSRIHNREKKTFILLVVILTISFLLRLYFIYLARNLGYYADDYNYVGLAQYILQEKAYRECVYWLWPPGYPFFIASSFYLFGENEFLVKFFQVFLSTITNYLIYEIARRIFDQKTGLVAAFIYAVYPTLIAYPHVLLSENLYIFLFVLSIFYLIKFADSLSRRDLILAGIILGLCAYVRSMILYAMPFILVWLYFILERDTRLFALRTTIFLGSVIVIVAPWVIRNSYTYKKFAFMEATLGRNMWLGNNNFEPFNYDWGFKIDPSSVSNARPKGGEIFHGDIFDIDRLEIKNGVQYIVDNPLLFVKRFWIKTTALWNPTSLLIKRIRAKGVAMEWQKLITFSTVFSYMAVMSLAIIGFFHAKDNYRAKFLFLMLIGYHWLAHGIVVAESRYRLPLMPLIMVFGSYGMTHFMCILKKDLLRWKNLGVISVLIVFIYMWSVHLPKIMDIFF